jgi:nucleoside-diphosphate-sugar epimerase
VKILDNLKYGYKDNFEDEPLLVKNFIQADIRDKDFQKYLKDVDVVYHFAAISALPECESNPTEAFDVNVNGLVNVLNACRNSKIKRIVFASTSAVYENNNPDLKMTENMHVAPNLVYSTSKYCAEQICKSYSNNYKMDIIIGRFFNVFGAHQDFRRAYPPFTSYLVREILNERKPIVYNISNVQRDYIYIDDLMIYLYKMCFARKKYNSEIFNLSSGNGYSALNITKTIFKMLNKKVLYTKGNPSEFWYKYKTLFDKHFNLSKERIKKEVYKHCIGSNEKIVKEFKYKPVSQLKEGLNNIISYQKKYGD